jgi:hypothetical protein
MKLRYTTFVEIMAACFSRKALRLCLPYLGATVSSWGPSWIFPKLLDYPKRGIAIIDETPVIHTRPIARGPNIALARQLGASPVKERDEFLAAHQITKRLETWGGIDANGNYTEDLTEIDRYLSPIKRLAGKPIGSKLPEPTNSSETS